MGILIHDSFIISCLRPMRNKNPPAEPGDCYGLRIGINRRTAAAARRAFCQSLRLRGLRPHRSLRGLRLYRSLRGLRRLRSYRSLRPHRGLRRLRGLRLYRSLRPCVRAGLAHIRVGQIVRTGGILHVGGNLRASHRARSRLLRILRGTGAALTLLGQLRLTQLSLLVLILLVFFLFLGSGR